MSGQSFGPVPRGIELLVKKASVDPEFKALLLADREAAAAAIELELEPSEAAMLRAVPREQLEAIIAHTTVPEEQRRLFLGKVAAAALAALGLSSVACTGVRPDRVPEPKGIRPDVPDDEQGKEGDDDPTRGIRPDRPARTLGIEPDRPARREAPPEG